MVSNLSRMKKITVVVGKMWYYFLKMETTFFYHFEIRNIFVGMFTLENIGFFTKIFSVSQSRSRLAYSYSAWFLDSTIWHRKKTLTLSTCVSTGNDPSFKSWPVSFWHRGWAGNIWRRFIEMQNCSTLVEGGGLKQMH